MDLELEIGPCHLHSKAEVKGFCHQCKGTGLLLSADEEGRTFARRCSCQALFLQRDLYNQILIPSHFSEATLANFQTTKLPKIASALQKAKAKLAESKAKKMRTGLLLYGSTGTGKTRLICALLRALVLEQRVRCRFIEFTQLLSAIKRGYDLGEYESEFLLPLVEVDVLAIDELGKGRKTDWETSILDQIIAKRYFGQKATFFTTNYPIEANQTEPENTLPSLRERIDFRIYSRLQEMTEFVDMDMVDFRAHPTKMVAF